MSTSKKGAKICPVCGAEFICGMEAGEEKCWCTEFPAVLPVEGTTTCLCPDCLKKKIDEFLKNKKEQ